MTVPTVQGLDEFLGAIDNYLVAVQGTHRDLQDELVVFAYDQIVLRSYAIVQTGAYRSSHTIAAGAGGPSRLIFEPPNKPAIRPTPGSDFSPLDPPSPGDADIAVKAQLRAFDKAWIYNDVKSREAPEGYASYVETGKGATPAYWVYRSVSDSLENVAQVLAAEGQSRLVAR